MPKSSGLNFDYFDAKEIMLRFDSDLAGLSGEALTKTAPAPPFSSRANGLSPTMAPGPYKMEGNLAAGEGARRAEFVDDRESQPRAIAPSAIKSSVSSACSEKRSTA